MRNLFANTYCMIICCLGLFHSCRSFECEICVPGTFCHNDNNYSCPVFSRSPTGADNISDCVCNAGYYKHGANPHVCLNCPVGAYCPGDNKQYTCPQNSEAALNSAEKEDCLCNAGFWRDSNTAAWCDVCPAGAYKSELGFEPCTVCPLHTFNEDTAGIASTNCENCPDNSLSGNSTQTYENRNHYNDCRCNDGFETLDSDGARICTACSAGYYDGRSSNNDTCLPCPVNTYSTTEASYMCTPCGADSATNGDGKTAIADCLCVAGHRRESDECVVCDAGLYQPLALGGIECEICPNNTFSASGASSCTFCHNSSVSNIRSESIEDCLCVAGTQFVITETLRQCELCDPGFFKSDIQNSACIGCPSGSYAPDAGMHECLMCPSDTYSENDDQVNFGVDECIACPLYSKSSQGADTIEDCLCIEGHKWIVDACVPCNKGFFKNSSHVYQPHNQDMCHACPTGKSTQITGSISEDDCFTCAADNYVNTDGSCVPCPTHSISQAGSVGVANCICQYGFTFYNMALQATSECVACAEGKYKSDAGNHQCTSCPAGKHAVSPSEYLDPIVYGTVWIDPLGVTETGSCSDCEANTFSNNGNCTACPANTVSETGSASITDCVCVAGFELDHNTCKECTAGFFKENAGHDACQLCAKGMYAQQPASIFCTACSPHSSTTSNGATQETDCVCNAGYYGLPGGPCTACPTGTFSLTNHVECTTCGATHYLPLTALGTEDVCTTCPLYSTVRQPPGSGIGSCVCNLGFVRVNNISCVLCSENHYCPSEHIIQPCPHKTHSVAGSHEISACECDAGFYGVNGSCQSCPVNSYCTSGTLEPQACGPNATTYGSIQQTNASSCVCLPGFYADETDNCVLCEPDSFCVMDAKILCPANSSALAGSSSVYECVCDAGMKLVEQELQFVSDGQNLVCVSCDNNEVCHARVNDAIETCAPNAKNVNHECQCEAGFYCASSINSTVSCSEFHRGTASCVLCMSGSHCSHNEQYKCRTFETSLPGSFLASDCHCVDGFYRYTGVCMPCETDYYCMNETKISVTTFDPNLRTRRTLTTDFQQQCTAGKCTHDITDAVCESGMFRTSVLDMCKPCPVNFYCPDEELLALPNVIRCPENEFTLSTGSSSRSECICLAGFKLAFDADDTMCLSCESGELCSTGVIQEQCHATNKVPNLDHTKCVCDVGHGYYSLECQECPSGSVKPERGDVECTFCGIDEYAVNTTTCLSCPSVATALPGSIECTCRLPYTWIGSAGDSGCGLCQHNEYWTNTGCASCPLYSVSNPSVDMNTLELAGVMSCRCAAGYEAQPRNLSGIWTCVSCPANTFEVDGVCVSCATNASSAARSAGAASCICNSSVCHVQHVDGSCAGECANPPPECSACDPGYHKTLASTPGNLEPCSICKQGRYQPLSGATYCEECPLHEFHDKLGAVNVSTCECVAGYTRRIIAENSVCVACNAGSFKNYRGDEACTLCQQGTYNPYLNSTVCLSCPDATANIASFQSSFAAENTELGNSSHPILQSNDTFAEGSSSVLDCLCPRGHEPVSVTGEIEICTPCVTGSFHTVQAHRQCTLCGANDAYLLENTYGTLDEAAAISSHHCVQCPLNSGQDADVIDRNNLMNEYEDCKCFPGFENRSLTGCSPCPSFQVQFAFSDANCEYCAAGYYFIQSYLPCQLCSLPVFAAFDNELQEGYVVNSIDNTLYTWGTTEDDCVCNLGYERIDSSCHMCSTGHYRSDASTRTCRSCAVNTYQDELGRLFCKLCPGNSSTLNATAASDASVCVCDVGYEVKINDNLEHGRECNECPAGMYRNDTTQAVCVLCPPDHFCPQGTIQPVPCPENEFSDAGSPSKHDCECGAGRGRGLDSINRCLPCKPGSFAPGRHNATCTPCPDNKNTSSFGSILLKECKCISGHGIQSNEPDGIEPCIACTNGFFASGAKNIACLHCGWGTVTEPETQAFDADCCLCDARIGVYEL